MAKKAASNEFATTRRTEFRRRVNEKLSRKVAPSMLTALDKVSDDKIDYLGSQCRWIAREAVPLLVAWGVEALIDCELTD